MNENVFKKWKDKTVMFVKEHKKQVITAGVAIVGIIAYVALDSLCTDENQYMDKLLVEDEHSDECLVDGVWKPMQREDGAYYSYAFDSDETREDFRQSGYHIVDAEE